MTSELSATIVKPAVAQAFRPMHVEGRPIGVGHGGWLLCAPESAMSAKGLEIQEHVSLIFLHSLQTEGRMATTHNDDGGAVCTSSL